MALQRADKTSTVVHK